MRGVDGETLLRSPPPLFGFLRALRAGGVIISAVGAGSSEGGRGIDPAEVSCNPGNDMAAVAEELFARNPDRVGASLRRNDDLTRLVALRAAGRRLQQGCTRRHA